MSLKKHIIVPPGFTSADAESHLAANRDCNSDRFPRLTKTEAGSLARAGRIEPLGSSGKVWRWAQALPMRSSRPTGEGRVSLEIPFALQSFMAGEMRRRPAWCVTI